MATTSVDEIYELAMTLEEEDRSRLLERLQESAAKLTPWEDEQLRESLAQADRGELVDHDVLLADLRARRGR